MAKQPASLKEFKRNLARVTYSELPQTRYDVIRKFLAYDLEILFGLFNDGLKRTVQVGAGSKQTDE